MSCRLRELGTARWCCWCYCYPQDPPGRLLDSRSPTPLSRRSQSPSQIRSVPSQLPRSPPRQDPPTRGTLTASASSPRSTRPPSWNNLHRHTASDPSPSQREGRREALTRRRNPTASVRTTDRRRNPTASPRTTDRRRKPTASARTTDSAPPSLFSPTQYPAQFTLF